jgi:hypothetical protein
LNNAFATELAKAQAAFANEGDHTLFLSQLDIQPRLLKMTSPTNT